MPASGADVHARRRWVLSFAALAVGLTLGVTALAGGALLLYTADRFLAPVGFLMAVALLSVAAGIWVGAPAVGATGERRMMTRWVLGVMALVLASFVASIWLRTPGLQTWAFGPPLALVLLLAEPIYMLAALLTALAGRAAGGERGSGVAVPALVGAGLGVAVAANYLIPLLPPGPVYLGAALLLTVAGTFEMGYRPNAAGGDMDGKAVLVSGVGEEGQIGYAVARAFVGRGARVVVTGRSEGVEARASSLGGDVVAVVADLADPGGAERVVEVVRERVGRLDVLVNVAGGLRVTKPVAETSPEEWRREHEANSGTAFLLTRAALPLLRDSGGAIVNFASPAGAQAMAGLGAYSAAKAGVIALTRALALEEGRRGVRVNAVAPGLVDTAENRAWLEGRGEAAGAKMVSMDEVVAAVLFLASGEASGISGEVLRVGRVERAAGGQNGAGSTV
jgi:3-oxoacyl-[acyl-carrier protein] reductase